MANANDLAERHVHYKEYMLVQYQPGSPRGDFLSFLFAKMTFRCRERGGGMEAFHLSSFAGHKKDEGEIRKGHQSYLRSVVKQALEPRKSKIKTTICGAHHQARNNIFF